MSKRRDESGSTPDLGLAPGIANIYAEIGYRKLGKADSVKIRIGGLPVNPKGTLKYGITFSPQGLYNEYRDTCFVIKEGRKISAEPLSDVGKLNFDGIGDLEAFNTSGGIANTIDSMLPRGVRECYYKTIRFPGHVDIIKFMLFECRMSLEAFSEAMINACGFITEDQVIMDIEVSREDGAVWKMKSRILHDSDFTAMQKTTGFGAAAVAAILGSGQMDGKCCLLYADVPEEEFEKNMKKLLETN